MPISEYHKSILNSRSIPLKKTAAAEERADTALRILFARIEGLIADSSKGDKIQRALWVQRQNELARLINEAATGLKRDMVTAVNETADEISLIRETETNELLRENDIALAVDFSGIPKEATDLLAQRQDKEQFKFSSNVWAGHQAEAINREVLAGVAGANRQGTLTRLRAFVLGSEGFSPQELADLRKVKGAGRRNLGTSINAKAKRLLRTEIGNAAWEAGRLSAEQSPVVGGVKWNLSARHPTADMCDYFSEADLYDLGSGVYPSEKLSPRGHPNCMCFQTDVILPIEEWGKPKETIDFEGLTEAPFRLKGTDRFNESQFEKFKDLILATEAGAIRA